MSQVKAVDRQANNSEVHHHEVCDNCASNFACSRLSMALKIANSYVEALPPSDYYHKYFSDRLQIIRGDLERAGWAYPYGNGEGQHGGEPSCQLAHDTHLAWKKIQALIDLMALMNSSKEQSLNAQN